MALLHQGSIIEQGNVIHFLTDPQTDQGKDLARACLKQELSPVLQGRLSLKPIDRGNPVLHILFKGDVTTEPLIADLISTFGLKLSILQGNIEHIRNIAIGTMVLEVIDGHNELALAIEYLQKKKLRVEVIGYVAGHVT